MKSRMLDDLPPLIALVRRDLAGGRRGAAVLLARALALVVASSVAMYALSTAVRQRGDASAGAILLFSLLMTLSVVLSPALAISALRREREAGMLDLLLIAGIRPGTLVLGRTLSTFLLFESMLLAALPAIALFWYFRNPSPKALLVACIAASLHFLMAAAVVVAISAWSRGAGAAIAFTLLAFIGLNLVLGMSAAFGWKAMPAVMMVEAFAPSGMPTPFGAGGWISGIVLQLALLVGCWAVAAAGVRRRRPAADVDRVLVALKRTSLPLDGEWPLTWLLRRGSAPARPLVQLGVVAPFALLALGGGQEGFATVGALMLLAGQIAAIGLGATTIAPQKEKKSWNDLLATSMPGRRLVLDLARGVVTGSMVPVLSGLVFMLIGAAGKASPSWLLGMIAAVLSTWLLTIATSLAASAVMRTTAAAFAVGVAFAWGLPTLVVLGQGWQADATRLMMGHSLGVLALVAVVALVGFSALVALQVASTRADGPARRRVVLGSSVTIALAIVGLVTLGILRGGSTSPLLVAALGACGLVLVLDGVREVRGEKMLGGVFLASAATLAILLAGLQGDDASYVAFSGLGCAVTTLSHAMGDADTSRISPFLGVARDGLVLLGLYLVFVPRLDRWLGRAA